MSYDPHAETAIMDPIEDDGGLWLALRAALPLIGFGLGLAAAHLAGWLP